MLVLPCPYQLRVGDKPVPPLALRVSDDIERIRQTRNHAFSHISSTPVSEADYKQYVQTAKDICNRMDNIHAAHLQKSVPGTYKEELNKILTETLDTEMYRSYVDALCAQAKREEDILERVTEMRLETQQSISEAKGHIVKTISEEEPETRKQLKSISDKGTEHLMKTQQSISQAEENIAQKITEEERDTRKELKSHDDKVAEYHMKTQQSMSQAERNIVQMITDDGSETRKVIKSLDKKVTGNLCEFSVFKIV